MNLKIFNGLERFGDHYPVEAVQYAMEHREEAIPELLEILEFTLNNVENLSMDKKYLIHFPAIYMLAYFREKSAYDLVIRIAYLPDEQAHYLLGDTITEDFGRILASVCDGNIEPMKGIIENAELDEYVRDQTLDSLLVLLNSGVVSREQLVSYFKQLFDGKLEVDYSTVWDSLPHICSTIHPLGLEDDIRKAVAEEKVMGILAELDFMKYQLEKPVQKVLDELKDDENYSMISDRDVYSLEGWVGVDYKEGDDDFETFEDEEDFAFDTIPLNTPVKRESFVGRNEPCPCGSGKKYKKCCGK